MECWAIAAFRPGRMPGLWADARQAGRCDGPRALLAGDMVDALDK